MEPAVDMFQLTDFNECLRIGFANYAHRFLHFIGRDNDLDDEFLLLGIGTMPWNDRCAMRDIGDDNRSKIRQGGDDLNLHLLVTEVNRIDKQ